MHSDSEVRTSTAATSAVGSDSIDLLYVIGSLDLGGTERHLAQLAPLLKKTGWSLAIYCLTHSGVQRAELERKGVVVIGPPIELKTKQRLFRFFALLASCLKLLTVLLRTRPRIVHFFLPLAYLIGAPLAIVSRIRIRLMSRRSLNYYQRKHSLLSWLERKLHRHVTYALGNSQAVVDDLLAEGVSKAQTRLIYNGIDLTPFDQRPPRTEDGHPSLVIVIVANLIPYKGHVELIEAVGAIAHKMPIDWQLWCVGRNDGLLAVLEQLAKEKNVERNVKFLGSRVDVPSLLQSADISVLSSHEEGFSNAILEAMAAGLPVVATNVGGNPEAVVHGETGIIVPPKNPNALAEAISRLASDPILRKKLGDAGRLRVQTNFSIDHCAQQYSDLYSNILGMDSIDGEASQPTAFLERLIPTKAIRLALLFCVSIAALLAAIHQVGFGDVAKTFAEVPLVALVSAAALMIAGALVASLRLYFIAKDLGWTLSAKDSLLALSVGQVASAASVQFFGQIVGRSAIFRSRGLSASANIAIATYERLSAVGASLSLAAVSAWYLFGRIAIDVRAGGDQFLLIAAGIAFATVAGGALGWASFAFRALNTIVTGRTVRAFARNMLLAFLIQFLTAGAYVTLASALAPNLHLIDVLAASLIVMFAASLPISFAGWGVRELSAAIALTAVGVASGAAVATAIIIGALALVSVIGIAAIASLLPVSDTRPPALPSQETRIDVGVSLLLPLLAATAVLFQLHVPVGHNLVNVNLADPIAILGGGVFALGYVFSKRTSWRLPNLNTFVLIATAVVGFALLNGFLRYGWVDWAFMNKGFGWLVLLCYGATGALIVHRNSDEGFDLLVRTFIGAVCGILFFATTVIILRRTGLTLPRSWFAFPLGGFSQNRNAFALILVLSVCMLPWVRPAQQSWLLGLFLAGIWLAGSRASFGAIGVLLFLLVALKQLALIQTTKGLIVFASIAGAVELAPIASVLLAGQTFDADAIPSIWSMTLSPVSSDHDRMKSLFDGLKMFGENPVLGQGLGSYIAQQKGATQLVIHSTPIWLLAEVGLIGLLAFAIPAIRIVQIEAKRIYVDRMSTILIGMLVSFGIMSAVHELLYQRAFWLLLGAALSMRVSNRGNS